MSGRISRLRGLFVCALLAVNASAPAQPSPLLTWITNSSVKLEQIIGDWDWEALAHGSNLSAASQTETRFQILGNGEGYSFEDNGRLLFLFGDTISGIPSLKYDAADPLAWCTNTDGETPLTLNCFTFERTSLRPVQLARVNTTLSDPLTGFSVDSI